jgi:hypothetical protein
VDLLEEIFRRTKNPTPKETQVEIKKIAKE